jgi:hypothetical protein
MMNIHRPSLLVHTSTIRQIDKANRTSHRSRQNASTTNLHPRFFFCGLPASELVPMDDNNDASLLVGTGVPLFRAALGKEKKKVDQSLVGRDRPIEPGL